MVAMETWTNPFVVVPNMSQIMTKTKLFHWTKTWHAQIMVNTHQFVWFDTNNMSVKLNDLSWCEQLLHLLTLFFLFPPYSGLDASVTPSSQCSIFNFKDVSCICSLPAIGLMHSTNVLLRGSWAGGCRRERHASQMKQLELMDCNLGDESVRLISETLMDSKHDLLVNFKDAA